MDLFGLLYLDELSHGLANLSMFPYFDMAHYVVSVMALREQPGKWLVRSSVNRTAITGLQSLHKSMGAKRLFSFVLQTFNSGK